MKVWMSKSARVILDWLPQAAARGCLHPVIRFIKSGGRFAGTREMTAGCATLAREYDAQKRLLMSLSTALESDFLDLGTKLGAILRKARAVQAECSAVNDLLSGHGEDPAIQFSFQLLKKAEDLVLGSYDQYAHVFEVFQQLATGLKEIESLQEQLRRTLRPLTVITIQFRIQSAILDGGTHAAFLTLAGEINALLQEMHQVVERQFQDLAQIQETTRGLMAELTAIIALHKGKISQTLQDCRDQLAMLGEALQRSDEGVRDLAGQTTGIQTGINRVIMALQCQDGTCQKIQHVGQAIDEMVHHLQAASQPAEHREAQGDLRQFLAKANVIQLSQIEAVFSQLHDAAGQIVEGIQVVEKQANVLTCRALSIGKDADENAVMERSILGMRSILSIVTASVFNVQKVNMALEPLKSKFTQCTEQISVLAHRVRVSALNAQIYAVGVERGASLEVLAEQTRGISDLILTDVSTIAMRLRDLSAIVEDLHQRLADFHQLSRQEEILLLEEAKSAVVKLERVKKDLAIRLGAIRPLQQELLALTQQTTASVSFPERVADVSTVAVGFFQRHAQTGGTFAPFANESSISDHRLDQLRQNYTMAHEREVHEGALRAEIIPPEFDLPVYQINSSEFTAAEPMPGQKETELPAVKQPEPSVKGDNLGANVELF